MTCNTASLPGLQLCIGRLHPCNPFPVGGMYDRSPRIHQVWLIEELQECHERLHLADGLGWGSPNPSPA